MDDPVSFDQLVLGVGDFVALANQTLEYAYPSVTIRGELSNFKVSKGKWVYFDLKDESASVRFFGTVYQLPGPLENGMVVVVRGAPRLHPQYGFSITVQSVRPEGEGAIRRASELLAAKLTAEGLFEVSRKRILPYPPSRIGLVTSFESAAYADFLKVLHSRWRGVTIMCADVQVQGEAAPAQIVAAIEYFNSSAVPPDVLVVVRGGGSADDLRAFSTEEVVRAVAASKVPMLVAVGHETDVSLAELAADKRASTPSNAAELLVPDRTEALCHLGSMSKYLHEHALARINVAVNTLAACDAALLRVFDGSLGNARARLTAARQLLDALDPQAIMRRGYAIIRRTDTSAVVRSIADIPEDGIVNIQLSDGSIQSKILKS